MKVDNSVVNYFRGGLLQMKITAAL